MKEILALLVLLFVRTTTPYGPDSDGRCRNKTTEYLVNNRCCKKCPPGQRLSQECSDTTESVCKQCDPNQYMEKWNYAQNCLPCRICRSDKGLQYVQNCSSTTRAGCVCKPGMYCIVEFDDPYCAECLKYSPCKAGFGVSVPGTAYSDVSCKRCPTGMFSDTRSYTDPCRPHTDCHGKAVVTQGNTVSDTLCEEGVVHSNLLQDTTKGYQPGTLFSTAGTIRSTVLAISDATLSVSATVSNEVFNHSTTSLPPNRPPGISLAAIVSGVIGILLLFIIIILVFLCKAVRCKDAEKFHPKVDANGNCERDKEITQSDLEETQLMCFTVTCPEQQSLLDKAGACSDYKPVTPQPSVPSESSSQPTSPQIISPLSANPQFNVNITFHIGNGSCGTPSVMPTHLTESDSHLPFGEEEESFSIPQQEDGKHPLRPVQASAKARIRSTDVAALKRTQ
ncbi:unnamed protein product [Pleuronectes platessa]|uniref:TNFR-Cys domain-containing protein n=1 Tax=Pleuronectes platessa TaxID=8262 RepID=A0A9N7W2A0_PLEPL|nr:unnamed protein product [Pleuronectes platessa]